MIEANDVAVVIVTRGDVPMRPILDAFDGFGFADGYMWNNGNGDDDLSVFGRYAAIKNTTAPVILTQDDDVILPAASIEALLAAYQPGKVVCNVPERFRSRYHDSGLVGLGAIFDRHLPEQALTRFYTGVEEFEKNWFLRTCDIAFTMLAPMAQVDLPYTELAYASGDDRMWKQPGHFEERERMRQLCRKVRSAN